MNMRLGALLRALGVEDPGRDTPAPGGQVIADLIDADREEAAALEGLNTGV